MSVEGMRPSVIDGDLSAGSGGRCGHHHIGPVRLSASGNAVANYGNDSILAGMNATGRSLGGKGQEQHGHASSS